jgi:hypothetical protein
MPAQFLMLLRAPQSGLLLFDPRFSQKLSSESRKITARHMVDSMLLVVKVCGSVGIDCALYISLVMF